MPVARILNLIVLALEARGLALSIPGRRWKIFAFYTQLSNLTAVISSLSLVMFGMVPTVIVLRYLSSCMLVMTVLVTVCVLIPLGGDPKLLLFSGSGLYVHLLCPTVSVGSYLLAEKHPQPAAAILLPTMLTLSYGLTMLWLNARPLRRSLPLFPRQKSDCTHHDTLDVYPYRRDCSGSLDRLVPRHRDGELTDRSILPEQDGQRSVKP